MLLSLTILLLYPYYSHADETPRYSYETKFVETPLDHFSTNDNRTFKLRYLVDGQYHVKGGPIFLYTGNEADITVFLKNTGFLFDIAPMFNALIVFAEHRYYGASLPFGNKSLTLANMRYLSTAQALRDFVHLIEHLKGTYLSTMISKDTYPFVAFGGSYGGMLAAWLRMKYPTSVVGAVAASAPVWMFGDLTPCDQFYQIVTEAFSNFGTESCSVAIKDSWKVIRNYAKTVKGKQFLFRTWRLCTPIESLFDVDTLLDWLTNIYVNLAMSNYHYPTDFIVPLPAYPVKIFCDKLIAGRKSNDTAQLIEAFAKALELYNNYTGKATCNNFNSTYNDPKERAWNYQTCTELVIPICSTEKDMFENKKWSLIKFADECRRKFDITVMKPDWVLVEYGGKNLRYFSNIVFSNGLMDPWACGGILKNVSNTIWAVNITDGVHHIDLRGADAADTDYVVEARKFHVNAIKKWLSM